MECVYVILMLTITRATLDLLNNPYILPLRQSNNLPFSQSNGPPIQFRPAAPTDSVRIRNPGGCMPIILSAVWVGLDWSGLGPLSAHINPIIMQCAWNHLIVPNPEGSANDARRYSGLWLYPKMITVTHS